MIAARLAIAALLALALTGCWALWQRGNAALARVDAITLTANTAAAELRAQRQLARDNADAANHLADALQSAHLALAARQRAATEVYRHDPIAKNWADQRLPDAVARLLERPQLDAAGYRQHLSGVVSLPAERPASGDPR